MSKNPSSKCLIVFGPYRFWVLGRKQIDWLSWDVPHCKQGVQGTSLVCSGAIPGARSPLQQGCAVGSPTNRLAAASQR